MSRLILLSAILVVLLLQTTVLAQSESDDLNAFASLSVVVRGQDDQPVENAKVEIRHWTGGEWVAIEHSGTTNESGAVSFANIPAGDYLTLLVKHADFASTMQDFSVQAGEARELTCKLLPSVEGELKILTPDGKPLKGAQITRLELVSPTNTKMFLNHRMLSLLADGDYTSDESGRLKLPPLPAGSKIKATVFHEDWAHGAPTSFDLSWGQMASIVLSPGTPIVCTFDGDAETLKAIEGKLIELRIFAREIEHSSLIHEVRVRNNRIKFTMPAGQYESLTMNLEGYLITPLLFSSRFDFDFINFAGPAEKTMVIRPTREIKGRIVNEHGNPVGGLAVILNAENLYFDKASNSRKTIVEIGTASSSYVITDSDGNYTAKLPKGKATISIQSDGYYFKEPVVEFRVEDQTSVPDVVANTMPTVAGAVVGQDGNPVSDAVVRVLSRFGETEYVSTDNNGKFEFKVSRFPREGEPPERQLKCSLIAFDPFSDAATRVDVDLSDESKFQNVEAILEPHEAGWVIEQIHDYQRTPESIRMMEKFKPQMEALVEKFPDGLAGKAVPNLSEGTWFNTDARSLDDFKGKFVLLDFWFIGCGPCVRDMPTVKKVHDLFADKGFTVVSVHIASGQTPDQVHQYTQASDMRYPVVVENAAGKITESFRSLGVQSYPAYILLDPEGRIVLNDQVPDPKEVKASLRGSKLEAVRQLILLADKSRQEDSK